MEKARLDKIIAGEGTYSRREVRLLVRQGRVLVVDGGGSVRRALVGGNLAAAAERNGWAGIVVHGCVRDAADLREAKVGIAALGLMPMPTEKRGQGQQNVVLDIAGARDRKSVV